MIKFGPAGNDEKFFEEGFKTLLDAPKWIKNQNLDLYEISFGHGIVVNENYAQKLKEQLIENNIEPSIHAPYYINFANPDELMIEKSMNYVINSLKILKIIGGKVLVIHSGTQLKLDRETALNNVKENYKELIKRIYEEKLDDMYICPETMGKFSQIGNVDEVIEICKLDKIVLPTFDFGHINSITNGSLKNKKDYDEIIKKCYKELGEEKTKKMHIHFSQIQYGLKGEIKHLTFEDTEFGPNYKDMIDALIENDISATVICESNGTMARDAVTMKNYYEERIKNFCVKSQELKQNDLVDLDKVYLCKGIQIQNINQKTNVEVSLFDFENNQIIKKTCDENQKIKKIFPVEKMIIFDKKMENNYVFLQNDKEYNVNFDIENDMSINVSTGQITISNATEIPNGAYMTRCGSSGLDQYIYNNIIPNVSYSKIGFTYKTSFSIPSEAVRAGFDTDYYISYRMNPIFIANKNSSFDTSDNYEWYNAVPIIYYGQSEGDLI
ncbi:MAG: TIM barrel protein, partial [Clostridia bacterium]|nr:TIM barrel protein [Clostridia bacterium]